VKSFLFGGSARELQRCARAATRFSNILGETVGFVYGKTK
jgi:hypothetical protein